ncbi:MAG: serine/threonine protein kinase [Deltaproteobacteria bacterium]|nr:serine/threonine protein kinase [Deltaproteobacteria bacterium]
MPHEATATHCPITQEAIEPRAPRRASVPPPPLGGHFQRDVPESTPPYEETSPSVARFMNRLVEGKYRIDKLIGKGGMGAVYQAEHVKLGKQVAIKVLLEGHGAGSSAAKRFAREARAAGSIGHPNIVQVFDLGTLEDGAPYLVMELLDGETLADRLELAGAIPSELTIQIMEQILSALHAAHERGIIHRDLKPDNVFLTQGRTGVTAKLLDFGVSKNIVDENTMSLTRTGAVVGTPYYLAPEQARGDRVMDRRVDIWAAGVLMYEALTGMLPFNADNYNALLVKILQQRPVPPSRIRPTLPPALEAVIMTAMAHEADERFATAEEMLEALEGAKKSQAQIEQNPTSEHESVEFDLGEQIGERTMAELRVSQVVFPGPEDPTEISDSFIHADVFIKDSDEPA